MKRVRTLILLLLCVTAVLCSLTALVVYREHRQERLNHDLIAAVKRNDTKAVISLLKQGADANCHDETYKLGPWWTMLRDRLTGSTALFGAVMVDNVEAVRLLLSYHADVTIRGWKGLTPLALTKGRSFIPQAQQIIHLLKQAGAK